MEDRGDQLEPSTPELAARLHEEIVAALEAVRSEPDPGGAPRADTVPGTRLDEALTVTRRLLEQARRSTAAAAARDTGEREEPTLRASESPTDARPTIPPYLRDAGLVGQAADENPTPHPSVDDAGPSGGSPTPPPQAPVAPEPAPEEALHVIADLSPRSEVVPGPSSTRVEYGLGTEWGAGFEAAAEGWVGRDPGHPVWRPVVASTDSLETWDVDTYVGFITSEVGIAAHGGSMQQLGATLAQAREVAMRGLVREAVHRGAHGVIAVRLRYTPLGARLVLSLTGTAVTLREKP